MIWIKAARELSYRLLRTSRSFGVFDCARTVSEGFKVAEVEQLEGIVLMAYGFDKKLHIGIASEQVQYLLKDSPSVKITARRIETVRIQA
jgi:hypothetical protein